MSGGIQKVRSIKTETKTTVTLTLAQAEEILRAGVGAPADAEVDIDDNYVSQVTITWTEVSYPEESEK